MPAPPFGTASAYTDSFPAPPPARVTIAAETCFNLSVFKDMVRQYRKLDDQIITRLNRANAQLRDQNRIGASGSSRSFTPSSPISDPAGRDGIEGMCTRMWSEMMSGWTHRQTLLTYCLTTVHQSLEAKKAEMSGQDEKLAAPARNGADAGRRVRGLKEEEVFANQLDNEESIEAIIRKRSLDAFKSRCPFFTPSPTDSAGRAWWDLANSGRKGRGPDMP
ncbi:caffeine-induced death protein 2-domain-containing protein [Dioszegia hungarica]|uniref:Caffeine-induced death protein 2-domain-containing protein n=1 Tax=Dioszegia hungarica TaxID=4972 RepID=A0AA38LVI7_9TREE|nr:caffeine-induced death protein 2-domain-containing protein [Dioszegia hungarica]KAI9635356.1 caffeine-induced death protein 2-domain-containing protein [Dioszegia hungarica]